MKKFLYIGIGLGAAVLISAVVALIIFLMPCKHQWLEATCVDSAVCLKCGVSQGSPLGHDFAPATCTAPKKCTRCALEEGEKAPHTWVDATCIKPKHCSQCSLETGTTLAHVWVEASCSRPKHCSGCDLTQGSALGHKWNAATCIKPKTCSVCLGTSGSPLGHKLAESQDGKTRHCSQCSKDISIKYVALTFDDGPTGNVTPSLLAGLKERNVKSTFFICGYRIKSFPTIPAAILEGGHEIGLHTMDHATLTSLNKTGIKNQLQGMLSLLPEGYTPTLMRPPGGSYNGLVKEVCKEMGLSVIMWAVDPRDWETNNVNTIVNKVTSGAYGGSIILMHDMKQSSVTAALQAIDILKNQGYEFVTVSELAKINGETLTPGDVYYFF